MFNWFRKRRRRKILAHPFPPMWREILQGCVKHYIFLNEKERLQLEELIQIFIAEKTFEGCGGLEMTDEIKVVIAGQACLLVLGLPPFQYTALDSVIVYPTTVTLPESRASVFATELFFDRSVRMEKEYPDLYQVLRAYYRQDTASREQRYRRR